MPPRGSAGFRAERRFQLAERVVRIIQIIAVLEGLFGSLSVQIVNVSVRIQHRIGAVLQACAEQARDAVEGVGDVAAARKAEFLNQGGRRDALPYAGEFVT